MDEVALMNCLKTMLPQLRTLLEENPSHFTSKVAFEMAMKWMDAINSTDLTRSNLKKIQIELEKKVLMTLISMKNSKQSCILLDSCSDTVIRQMLVDIHRFTQARSQSVRTNCLNHKRFIQDQVLGNSSSQYINIKKCIRRHQLEYTSNSQSTVPEQTNRR